MELELMQIFFAKYKLDLWHLSWTSGLFKNSKIEIFQIQPLPCVKIGERTRNNMIISIFSKR